MIQEIDAGDLSLSSESQGEIKYTEEIFKRWNIQDLIVGLMVKVGVRKELRIMTPKTNRNNKMIGDTTNWN